MKRIRRSSRGIDIHSPQMVKTIFILSSVAILAFLVLVVKYTSFSTDSQAAPRKKTTLPKKVTKTMSTINRTSCYNRFTKDYLADRGFTSADLSSMINDINTSKMSQNTIEKRYGNLIKDGIPSCDFNYTDIGDINFRSTKCCVKNDYINDLTLKKMAATTNSNSLKANARAAAGIVGRAEGTTITDCGSAHINCSNKYGSAVYNSTNSISYTTMCVKDMTANVDYGFRCAINVGTSLTCTDLGVSQAYGVSAPANDVSGNTSYYVCFLTN